MRGGFEWSNDVSCPRKVAGSRGAGIRNNRHSVGGREDTPLVPNQSWMPSQQQSPPRSAAGKTRVPRLPVARQSQRQQSPPRSADGKTRVPAIRFVYRSVIHQSSGNVHHRER